MSPSNPSLGAAGEVASAAAQVGNAVISAARQQQALQQQKQQQARQEEVQYWQAIHEGGQDYQPLVNGPPDPQTGLVRRSPNPAVQGLDPARVRTFPLTGKQVYMPTEQELAAQKEKPLDDSNSFVPAGALADALSKTGAWHAPAAGEKPQRVPLTHVHDLMQSLSLAAKDDEPEPLDIDTTHFNQPVGIGKKSGSVKALKLPDGVAPAAAKPDLQSIIPGYTGPGGGPITRDTKTGAASELQLPAGSKASLTAAQQEVADRAAQRAQDRQDRIDAATETKKQAGIDAAQKQIDVYQRQEQEQHGLRLGYGQALTVGDGKQVIDPKTRQTVVMNPARRMYYQQQYQGATNQVQRLQDTQQKLLERHGAAAAQPAGAQPAGQPAAGQPAAQPAAAAGGRGAIATKPLTDESLALKYLKQAGGDRGKARKLAAADGWSF